MNRGLIRVDRGDEEHGDTRAGEQMGKAAKVIGRSVLTSISLSPIPASFSACPPVPSSGARVIRGQVTVNPWQSAQQTQQAAQEKLAEAKAEAEAVLAEAREAARLMIEMAQANTNEIRAQAWTEGYAEGVAMGRAEGLKAGHDEIAEQLRTVRALVEAAASARRELLRELEPEIIELTLDIVSKIIGESIRSNPALVINVVAQALRQVAVSDSLRIRLNPRDAELLQSHWAEALENNPGDFQWEIVADPRISSGGCVVETPSGKVDAQIETQMVQIRSALLPGKET